MTQDQINIELCKIMQNDIKRLQDDVKYAHDRLDRAVIGDADAYSALRVRIDDIGYIARGSERKFKKIGNAIRAIGTILVGALAVFGLMAILSSACHAQELTNITTDKWSNFKLFEADRLDMEYRKVAVHRDFFYEEDNESFVYGTAVLFDFRIARYFYWRNNVHMLATQTQVRAVGWEFEQGVNASKYLDLFYYHHSQHVMERERDPRGYPLTNEYGVRFHFITEKSKR